MLSAYADSAHMYASIIQHIVKGISAPTADCRPPALRKIGSVKTLGDLTHPAISGFYIASYGKAVNIENKWRRYRRSVQATRRRCLRLKLYQ